MPTFVRTLVEAGTSDYPPDSRQRLIVINIVGYLAALSSLNYAATYASYDYTHLWPLVHSNILSAVLTASAPFWHRFGRLAAMFFLIAVIYSTIFYFVSYLGRDAGIQLNYIGASAVVLVVCGQRFLRYAGLAVLLAAALHLIVWFKYPVPRPDIIVEKGFLADLYVFSVISIMTIIFVVVFYAFHLVRKAQAETDALLLNIMPGEIAARLKRAPDDIIADQYENTSVLFADITGFTALTSKIGPDKTIAFLNNLYSRFDQLAASNKVEKIKTIGDSYMVVSGLPTPDANHANNIAQMALGLLAEAAKTSTETNIDFGLRIGIASGPVMAGIIGTKKFAYDVWGEPVNLAARLEANARRNEILIDKATRNLLADTFKLANAGKFNLKGIGDTPVWKLHPPS